ncbi:MAG: hypothetical protein KGS60_17675 [Verrucomicrobia bacterium]|nr:hypothetical protein [Verrucomicrobiota bacterium]
MNKYIHDPQHRARMRELIQGFIEHCEVSPSLIGRIGRVIECNGRKYGVPVFTIHGPAHDSLNSQFVGLAGVNAGRDARAAETLLQLIERLAIQPRIAAGHVLEILPVTDPVGLELGAAPETAPAQSPQFRGESVDGLIELEVTDTDSFVVTAEGDFPFRQAVASAEEGFRRLASEEPGDRLRIRSSRVAHEGAWKLRLQLPATWSPSVTVHWGSQFLVLFFRAHVTFRALAPIRLAK